jgi:hypothetical protein
MSQITYNQLNTQEQTRIQKSALEYFHKKKTEIYQQVSKTNLKTAPPGIDLYSPEKWNEANWRWFLDNNFLL